MRNRWLLNMKKIDFFGVLLFEEETLFRKWKVNRRLKKKIKIIEVYYIRCNGFGS